MVDDFKQIFAVSIEKSSEFRKFSSINILSEVVEKHSSSGEAKQRELYDRPYTIDEVRDNNTSHRHFVHRSKFIRKEFSGIASSKAKKRNC